MKRLMIIFLLLQTFIASPSCVCIVVHGTWDSSADWWRPGGDFFEALKEDALDFYDGIIPFQWSGQNNSQERRVAGKELAKLIEQHDQVIIIAHGHGATVGILASHYLSRNFSIYQSDKRYKIAKFYALGVPVDEYEGLPDMNIIGQFYNIFSFNDPVQSTFGMFERTFTQHERIANLSISLEGKRPFHSELHHPIIGEDLLKISDVLFNYSVNNFECFSFWRPGFVSFAENISPCYSYDRDREYLLECDKEMTKLLLLTLTRSKESYRLKKQFENSKF